jgi:hypothetical protein
VGEGDVVHHCAAFLVPAVDIRHPVVLKLRSSLLPQPTRTQGGNRQVKR